MKHFVRRIVGRLPFTRPLYGRYLAWKTGPRVNRGTTCHNVLEAFPAFVANGWGLYKPRAALTVKSVNQTIPALVRLAALDRSRPLPVETFRAFAGDVGRAEDTARLKKLFDDHGSDKASRHDYYLAYARILGDRHRVGKVFEIGLGTNNVDVVSTMGRGGRPGASLRAFRDYCPKARIFGADFDRRVLFSEERIRTFFVDQTEPETFTVLGEEVGSDFDLMIDDGLHAPNANLHSLAFFLPRLRAGGWAVIEDITPASESVWRLVAAILSPRYECHLLQSSEILMFLARKQG